MICVGSLWINSSELYKIENNARAAHQDDSRVGIVGLQLPPKMSLSPHQKTGGALQARPASGKCRPSPAYHHSLPIAPASAARTRYLRLGWGCLVSVSDPKELMC
eukprot:4847167-Prymnesium_polylepis.1